MIPQPESPASPDFTETENEDRIWEQNYFISFGFDTCYECGKLIENNYGHDENTELCFHCNHWNEHLKNLNNPDSPWNLSIIIDGLHYRCYPGIHRGNSLGMAGRHFLIRHLESGTEIETNHLWHQGTVADHFRDRMPNNCRFVTRATGGAS